MTLSPAARTILIAGSLILAFSLGLRHAFGLFLQPVSLANGWGREVFGFAIALQNLAWGAAQPFAGMLSDRYGAGRVILGGALLYALGLMSMAYAGDATSFTLAAGVLVGLGLAGTTMPIVFGAVSRALPAEKRSLAFGVAMSVGSIGQFLMLPGALALIDGLGWAQTLVIMSALAALMLPLAFFLMERKDGAAPAAGPSAGEAVRLALGDRGYWLLSLGFFVCGFQVVFIATHIPAFLADQGQPAWVGSTVLALIGLFNIFGSLAAGYLGAKISKPWLLAGIYLGRAAAIAIFIFLPITPASAFVFASLMGLLWLSTVPLTNGVVAAMFGVKNMAMLGGIVFFAHQIGSFLGGWLGGLIYDRTGSYDLAWGVALALSLIAALLNLPVKETAVVSKPAERRA
jgi:MFS family permease